MPGHVAATVYKCLGIPIDMELKTPQGRVVRLVDHGFDPIDELVSMKRRNYFTFTVALLALLCRAVCSASFPSQAAEAMPPYHQKVKPKGSPAAACRSPSPTRNRHWQKSKFCRLRLRFVGPRYSQRLVVEGTFADGHQEDLTVASADHQFRWQNCGGG